ncbi:MAG: hypothetical protein ACRDIB_03195 [Ardenticatenaceae bacterium]
MTQEKQLYELAVRLLTPSYPGMPSLDQAQLFVGELPDTLPAPLPLPDGATVIGSVVRGEMLGAEIALDVELPADAIRAFYTVRMSEAGWSSQESFYGHGGFTHAGDSLLFCRGPRGPAVQVHIRSQPDAPSEVRLHVHTHPRHSPCSHRGLPDNFQRLPGLHPPAGARQQPGGGSSGGDTSYSTATLQTELDMGAVRMHYEQQLEQAGWQRSASGGDEVIVWSTWTVQDEVDQPWEGLFFVFRYGEIDQYQLQMHLRWAEGEALSSQ